MITFRTRSIAALVAAAATFVTVSASAPAEAQTFTAAVHYGDLDLNSPADAVRLHRRIRAAATEVCGPQDAMVRREVNECRRTAIARAEADLPVQHTQLARR